MALVSIITATLNRPSLQEACESIDSQTFEDWHHYVIGDGILPVDFSHPERTTIGFTRPIGASQPALNMPEGTPNPILGWALQHLALGEFVCFLDDDNVYRPEFLQTMVQTLVNHPEIGIAICAAENKRGEWQEIDGYPEYRRCDNSGFMVRSSIAKRIGFPPARPDRECVQDYEFIRACAEQYGWIGVQDKLVVFGSSPNPPPGRGGIKVVDSWSLPLKGVSLTRSGHYQEGIKVLASACEIDQEDAWALWHLGEAWLCSGHPNQAVRIWNKWRDLLSRLELWPNDWVHYCYALASFVAQDTANAQKHLIIAISKAEDNQPGETILQIDNLFNLGLYSLLNRQAELAYSYYRQSLDAQPDQALPKEAIWNLKVLQATSLVGGDVDKAIQLLESHQREEGRI